MYLLRKAGINAIFRADDLVRIVDSLVNVLDGGLKVVNIAVLSSDYFLPVPLID
jgi:hypothetical protein